MKLAVSTYSLWRWMSENHQSLEQAIDQIAELGAEGIEFAGLDPQPRDDPLARAHALRRHCAKRRLEIVGYCTAAELLVEPKQQKKEIERLKKEVDVAAALGTLIMRHDVTCGFDAYKNYSGPKTFAAALKIVVPAIRAIADYGQSKRVATTVENHGFYMQASKRVEQLIEKVNHRNYALTLDMGNFLCVNEDPVEAVRRLAPYTVLAHVKDFHIKPKKDAPGPDWFDTPKSIALRGAIVGHGQIDVPAQLRILKQAKYTGYLSQEFEGMEEPLRAIKLGLNYTRKQLQKIKALG